MKMMKRVVAYLVLFTLVFGLVGCGNTNQTNSSGGTVSQNENSSAPSGDQEYVINLGTTWANDHPVTVAIDNVFIPYITEHTNGRIKINHLPNNQMGTERELYEAAISGQLEMVAIGNLLGNNVVPELNIQEIPFLWNDESEFWDICGTLDSEFCVNAQSAFDELGLDIITLHKRGFRQTTCNRPLNTLEDFNGVIMRMPEVDFIINTWETFGTVPSIIAWSETYTALQQHTAEGSEGSLDSIYAMKLYEVQDYLAMTSHVLSIGMLLSNDSFFKTLPEEYRQVILDAGKLLQEEVFTQITNSEDAWVKDMQEQGVTVTYPDRSQLREACRPVVVNYIQNTECARDILRIFGKTDYLTELGLE